MPQMHKSPNGCGLSRSRGGEIRTRNLLNPTCRAPLEEVPSVGRRRSGVFRGIVAHATRSPLAIFEVGFDLSRETEDPEKIPKNGNLQDIGRGRACSH